MKKSLRGCLRIILWLLAGLVFLFAGIAFLLWRQTVATPVKLDSYGGMVQAMKINQIATSPDLPGVMLAGSGNAGDSVIYSLDGGQHWNSIPSVPWTTHYMPSFVTVTHGNKPGEVRLNVTGSAPGFENPAQIFSLIPGQSVWSKTGFPACPPDSLNDYFSALSISPADPQRMYVLRLCDNVDYSMQPKSGPYHGLIEIYASADGGLTFQRVYNQELDQTNRPVNIPFTYEPLPADFPVLVLPSPVNPEQVYLNPQMVSNDAGRSWSATNFPVDTLVLDGVDPERLYGIRVKGGRAAIGMTRLSPAAGWKEWPVQPCQQILQLVAHPTRVGTLFIRCGSDEYVSLHNSPYQEELLLSEDSGASWKHLSEWSGNWIGPDYGFPGRMLWARNDGLWATTDLGQHWTHLTIGYQTHPEQGDLENFTPPGGLSEGLSGAKLAAVSPNDIWVGDYFGQLMHWDGQSWSRVPFPESSKVIDFSEHGNIYGLTFVNSAQGWMAFGDTFNSPDNHLGIVYHWDGKSWQQSSPAYGNILNSIAAIGDQAWAVGENGLIVHWDGKSWTEMHSPVRQANPRYDSHVVDLFAISMISVDEGWAVGGPHVAAGHTYILHYKNGVWQIAYDSDHNGRLKSLSMASADLGWAGGGCDEYNNTVFLRWDGKDWQTEQSMGTGNKQICFLSAFSAQNAWAESLSGNTRNLLHWNGNSWKILYRDEPFSHMTTLAVLPDGNAWFGTRAGTYFYYFLVHSKFTP
jgi:hypothetical protein